MNKALSLRSVLAALLCLLLAGCFEPSPKETTPQDAQALVDAMTYVKAKNGLCFGVATARRFSTDGSGALATLAVEVDCAKVKL